MKTLITTLSFGFLMFSVGCQNQSANRQVKDATITGAVKTKLAADVRLAALTNLDVTTENSNVSLNGTVESEEIKRLSEESARAVDGVARVINNLQVVPKAATAEAHFIDSAGNPVGKALITEEPAGGLRFHLTLRRLPSGFHGIHVHETGDCTKPDFKSAGKHFNPEGKQHGAKNPKGFHAGDLGNIEVGSEGTADVEVVAPQLTLKATDHSLIRPDGTAIIIHAGRDDQKSDPSGNSGNPIACGVIEKGAFTHSGLHTNR
ncbi:MAG: superoxide dismutase family protein [Acidobacteria bacterium]|nr:superoxide dismutase family protein [Acidobacteriota bacterium]